jgi:hypothetical protein
MQVVAERMIDMPLSRQILPVVVCSLAIATWDGDWITGVALLALWVVWAIVPAADGAPVLALALTFQWVQATAGLFYASISGRLVGAMFTPVYREMVLIALGCIVMLALGLNFGARAFLKRAAPFDTLESVQIGWPVILICYTIPLAAEPLLLDAAFSYPAIGQAILALRFVRLAALYLVLRRLVNGKQWLLFGAVLVGEMGLSLTSFYAGFREPLVVALAAVLERFHPRRLQHWAALVFIVLAGTLLGLVWLGVRSSYRADYDSDLLQQTRQARTSRLVDLGAEFLTGDPAEIREGMDALVDRMWPMLYPALALDRVPDVIPHTDGALFSAALQHVFMPRLLFPDKAALPSDSDLVRRYSGVYVAGEEQDTSIAFGYVAESYLDFGVPLMFLPSLAWGCFLGLAFGWLATRIQTRELRVGLLMVVFWIALYLFERSWAKTMGASGTLLIYLGVPVLLFDRILYRKAHEQLHHVDPPLPASSHAPAGPPS